MAHEHRIRVCQFEHREHAETVAKKMISLPHGWRCEAGGDDGCEVFVIGPRRNWSCETGLRVSAFVEGYRACLYV